MEGPDDKIVPTDPLSTPVSADITVARSYYLEASRAALSAQTKKLEKQEKR